MKNWNILSHFFNFCNGYFVSIDLEIYSDGWDRACLELSSVMAEPFCAAYGLISYRLFAPMLPGKFDQCATKTAEVAVRTLIALGAIAALFLSALYPFPILFTVAALGICSRLLRAIGFALQKGGITHVKGNGAEEQLSDGKLSGLTWNICGIDPLSKDHGGVISFRNRIDRIVENIRGKQVVVLQEVYDTALAEGLIQRLKEDFAHFFIHLGPNTLGSVSGLMVMTKCAVERVAFESFKNNSWSLNRGFLDLELRKKPAEAGAAISLMGTHFIHGNKDEDRNKRMNQAAQMADYIGKKAIPLPTVVAGDLNDEGIYDEWLRHGYEDPRPTCTNKLVAQWDSSMDGPDERIDYVSAVKSMVSDAIKLECQLLVANDGVDTTTALSDHHGIEFSVSGL